MSAVCSRGRALEVARYIVHILSVSREFSYFVSSSFFCLTEIRHSCRRGKYRTHHRFSFLFRVRPCRKLHTRPPSTVLVPANMENVSEDGDGNSTSLIDVEFSFFLSFNSEPVVKR